VKKLYCLIALVEFASGLAAAAVLLPRVYYDARYSVETVPVPLVNFLAFVSFAAVAAAGAFLLVRRPPNPARTLALAWLPLLANILILARAALGIAPDFFEPLVIALSSAASVAFCIAWAPPSPLAKTAGRPESRLPAAAMAVLAVAAALWMYGVQEHHLRQMVYGFRDAGIYYLRVKNTALGRGLLQESPATPPFFDHFDAGLLLLVPFYWLFKTFRIVMWTHAIVLAAIGPAVFAYARGRGLSGWTAFAFGAAALLHPAITQMSLSFTYGFHPITVAIPAVILSIHFWEKGRWRPFVAWAALAASMEETVFPLYVGVGLVEALSPRGRRRAGLLLLGVSLALFFIITNVIMPAFDGTGGYFQMTKYARLGGNVLAVALSPVTKPAVFWGLIFERSSFCLVALLLGSMFFLPLAAPRQLLYPAVVLVFTLLLPNPNVKAISYWYPSLILAAWLVAMVAGAARLASWAPPERSSRVLSALAAAAVLCALVASHFYGIAPFSRITVPFQTRADADLIADAARLREFAATVRPPARVLATARAAMLFCDAGEVTPLPEWDRKSTDYDVIVLQPYDDWGQGSDDLKAAMDAVAQTGRFTRKPIGLFFVFVRNPGV
jgi:uncharacterized membrane protein